MTTQAAIRLWVMARAAPMPGQGLRPLPLHRASCSCSCNRCRTSFPASKASSKSLQNDVSRMKQENLERYQDLDRRINSGAAPAATPDNSSGGGASTTAPDAAAGAAAQQPAANSEPGDPAKEKLYYDAAFDLIKQKDFDKASQAFNAFLRKYPNSQYAGNAQYWLGEVNLAKGDLPGASQAFAQVSQKYPKHSKVPDSLYKLADVERRMGHTDKVKGILQQVITQYPGTSAAQLAQRDLQKL